MSLQDQPITALIMKIAILDRIISENSDDPRIEEPKRQLKILEDELNFRNNRDKEQDKDSKNLVIGLRTLKMKSFSSLKK